MASVLPQQRHRTRSPVKEFPGFAAPTSNTTFTPNQFFDVCVPNYSRGVVRLVAFLIRQALGWCDAEGNPQHEQIRVSYNQLVTRAGIARSEIRKTLDAALQGGFIDCVHAGQASRAYSPAESASYQLRWDSRPEYIKDPKAFRGFFEGQVNRTQHAEWAQHQQGLGLDASRRNPANRPRDEGADRHRARWRRGSHDPLR